MAYYINKYYDVISKRIRNNPNNLSNRLKEDLIAYIRYKEENTGIDADFFTEKQILDFVKDFMPEEDYKRSLFIEPLKREDINRELRELRDKALRRMWFEYTGVRDALIRQENGIQGQQNYNKIQDEIWLDEPRKRQVLPETAPYKFKRNKYGHETRTYELNVVSLAALKNKLKRYKFRYDPEAFIIATDRTGVEVFGRDAFHKYGTLKDLEKASSITFERPFDQITEEYVIKTVIV